MSNDDEVVRSMMADLHAAYGDPASEDGDDGRIHRLITLIAILPDGSQLPMTRQFVPAPDEDLLVAEAKIVDQLYDDLTTYVSANAQVVWKVYRRTPSGDQEDTRLSNYAQTYHKIRASRGKRP